MIAAFNYGLQYFQTLQFDRLKVSKKSIPTITIDDIQDAVLDDTNVEIDGNDCVGSIDLLFDGVPVTGNLITVTFNKPYINSPYVIISSNSITDVVLSVLDIDTTGFTVSLTNTGIENDVISFTYLCIESS